ncbi:unnamed protein product [Lactuca saligna]|uniref:Arabidopsis retrotransposon Orf1 C-terminal domain-containing protein n=1 Tax=Lactuca saligna TaxID=75948 RepID=A0AA35VBP6_LACSI|nr:unnamed protein product [Lactuca saligna]
MTWWTQLTQLHPYVSSAAKASSLIHPVIKVAHRIIASLVAPREERSTISALELKILYAMTHPENNLIPHYGRFLCHKLIRLSASRSGKIVCGGIVSMLAKSAHIRAPDPDPHQPLSGEPYLTTTVLESMRLFRSAGDGTHHWTVGQNHDPKLLITPENKGILDFRNPIHMTDWKSFHTSSPTLITPRSMSKAKKTRKMVMMMKKRRSLTMLLPPVVAAHPILLHPRLIINNIWTNSNQSIPASTPISRILPA